MKRIALILALLITPAAAQDAPLESVTVDASALVGVWKIAWPQWGRMGFGGASWGPMADRFCRIEPDRSDLSIHCFRSGGNTGSVDVGTVSLDGAKIHFAWGSMMLRTVLDGSLQSPTRIVGRMGVKLSGIEHENPAPSGAQKFSLSQGLLDKPGKTTLLRSALEQLSKGSLSLPHDDAAMGKAKGTLPADIATLGTLQTVAYLGQASREVFPGEGGLPKLEDNFFSVYAVEFDNGERICGLHQRDDGVLDAFRCV